MPVIYVLWTTKFNIWRTGSSDNFKLVRGYKMKFLDSLLNTIYTVYSRGLEFDWNIILNHVPDMLISYAQTKLAPVIPSNLAISQSGKHSREAIFSIDIARRAIVDSRWSPTQNRSARGKLHSFSPAKGKQMGNLPQASVVLICMYIETPQIENADNNHQLPPASCLFFPPLFLKMRNPALPSESD